MTIARSRHPTLSLALILALGACRAGSSAGSGVVVREVLHGDAAGEGAPAGGSAEVAPTPPDVPTTLGTTVVSDTPQAIYRQAQERARRTLDADNLRHNLKVLGEAVDRS